MLGDVGSHNQTIGDEYRNVKQICWVSKQRRNDFSVEVNENRVIQVLGDSVDKPQLIKQLIDALQGEMTIRELADLVGIDNSTFFHWMNTGRIGSKGRQALCAYMSKAIAPRDESDLQLYLDGEIDLAHLLDPLWKLETDRIAQISVEDVLIWIDDRANISEAIKVHRKIQEKIERVLSDKLTTRLIKDFAKVRQQGISLKEISENTGLPVSRVSELSRGESLPCKDELVALSPYLNGSLEEMLEFYGAGT